MSVVVCTDLVVFKLLATRLLHHDLSRTVFLVTRVLVTVFAPHRNKEIVAVLKEPLLANLDLLILSRLELSTSWLFFLLYFKVQLLLVVV